MTILSIALILFVVLETANVVTLYFWPGSRLANGVGVFCGWEASKADPALHQFVRYLMFWVAGAKLIFIALLVVILLTAGEVTRLATVVALIASILSFFWRLYPLVRSLDRAGEIQPAGYSRALAYMIAGMIALFALALIGSLVMWYVIALPRNWEVYELVFALVAAAIFLRPQNPETFR